MKEFIINFILYILLIIILFLYIINRNTKIESFKINKKWFNKNILNKIKDFYEDGYDYLEYKIKDIRK